MSKGHGTWLGGYLLQVFPTYARFVAFYRYVAFFNPYIHACMHTDIYIYIYTVYVCIHIDTYTCHNLGSSHHVLHPQIYRSKNSFHTWNCKGSTHHELRQPRKSAVARCPTWCSWASSCNGWPVFFAQNGKKLESNSTMKLPNLEVWTLDFLSWVWNSEVSGSFAIFPPSFSFRWSEKTRSKGFSEL